jgi:ubiquitin-conjugating enzyme E2 G1
MALKRLQSEYKQYLKDPSPHYTISIDEDNFYKWNILLFGSMDTIFEGAIFTCLLEFPKEYPNLPPVFTITSSIFHPNVFPNGKMCISILHEGIDQYGYEDISLRWKPSHSVNSIILSVLIVLTEPNFDSPANIVACKMWQENYQEYKKTIYKIIANQ